MSQNSDHLKLGFSHEFPRSELLQDVVGDSHRGCAADKTAATVMLSCKYDPKSEEFQHLVESFMKAKEDLSTNKVSLIK